MKRSFWVFSVVLCLFVKSEAVIVQNETDIILPISCATGNEGCHIFEELKPGTEKQVDIKIINSCFDFAIESKGKLHRVVIRDKQYRDSSVLRLYEQEKELLTREDYSFGYPDIIVEYEGEVIGKLSKENFLDSFVRLQNKCCALTIAVAYAVAVVGLFGRALAS